MDSTISPRCKLYLFCVFFPKIDRKCMISSSVSIQLGGDIQSRDKLFCKKLIFEVTAVLAEAEMKSFRFAAAPCTGSFCNDDDRVVGRKRFEYSQELLELLSEEDEERDWSAFPARPSKLPLWRVVLLPNMDIIVVVGRRRRSIPR